MTSTKALTVTAIVILCGVAAPVHSHTARVHCLHVKSPVKKRTEKNAHCQFSQSQGNVHIVMYRGNSTPLQFEFPTSKQNLTYQRLNYEGGINFATSVLTLKVF